MSAENAASKYVDPYDNPDHDAWVDDGNCDAIHVSKAWCNEPARHRGDHCAPYLDPDGQVRSHLWWNDADNHPRRRNVR